MRTIFFTLLFIAGVSSAAMAQISERDQQKLKEGIGIVTGQPTGTYIKLGQDISEYAKPKDVNIIVRQSAGSVENIKRISSTENTTLGIVQSDVLSFLSRSQNPDTLKIARDVRLVFPFGKEEVHLLARADIDRFTDLQNKRVVVGLDGSGNIITSYNLMHLMDIKPQEMIKLPPAEGITAVLENRADAMIFVGGKPVKLFENLQSLAKLDGGKEMLDQVHFLPMNYPVMLKEYEPALLSADDYDFIEEDVPTLAIRSILISFNFDTNKNSYHKTRCKQLEMVGDALRQNIDVLKEKGHSKWSEVNLDARLRLWQRDTCIWPEPEAVSVDFKKSGLGKDLIEIINQVD